MLQLSIKPDKNNGYKVIIKIDKKNTSMKNWAALINELVNNTDTLTKAIGQELTSILTEEQEIELANMIVKIHESFSVPDNSKKMALENAKKPSVPPKIMINKNREVK